MNEFDLWREKYESMTYAEQLDYHDSIEARFPEQAHYNYEQVRNALLLAGEELRVLEFGCWKADMAARAIEEFPGIKKWYGIEICRAAIEKTRCKSDKFHYIFPQRFDWFQSDSRPLTIQVETTEAGPAWLEFKSNIILATHFIEHLSNPHFEALANFCVGAEWIYFEAPLLDVDREWQGYEGTHKLNYGWNNIVRIFAEKGYELVRKYPEAVILKQISNN